MGSLQNLTKTRSTMVLPDFQVDQAQDLVSLQEPKSLFLKMNLAGVPHRGSLCVCTLPSILFLVLQQQQLVGVPWCWSIVHGSDLLVEYIVVCLVYSRFGNSLGLGLLTWWLSIRPKEEFTEKLLTWGVEVVVFGHGGCAGAAARIAIRSRNGAVVTRQTDGDHVSFLRHIVHHPHVSVSQLPQQT